LKNSTKKKPFKFRLLDYKKIYYFKRFGKIPYKDYFIYQPNSRLPNSLKNTRFFIYGGRF